MTNETPEERTAFELGIHRGSNGNKERIEGLRKSLAEQRRTEREAQMQKTRTQIEEDAIAQTHLLEMFLKEATTLQKKYPVNFTNGSRALTQAELLEEYGFARKGYANDIENGIVPKSDVEQFYQETISRARLIERTEQ